MKNKIPWANAYSLAERIASLIEPACQRVEIAGSLRRRIDRVGDIEIVCVPHRREVRDLFGELVQEANQLEDKLHNLIDRRYLTPGDRNGPKYKQFTTGLYNVQLDLFITDPTRWGLIYTLRTGSADFSRWLVTPQTKGGALPPDMKVNDGRLWRAGQPLDTPQEEDIFRALSLRWIHPAERQRGIWNPTIRANVGAGSPRPAATDNNDIPF